MIFEHKKNYLPIRLWFVLVSIALVDLQYLKPANKTFLLCIAITIQ